MAITPSQWSHVLTIPESYTPSAATSGQTLVITESVIAKLSAGDQSTFWSNVANGGGDVRICTDSAGTNQLPVEIVSLDNVAQTCVIWTRKATYAGTGDLYVFIGKAGETQPAVTDPFGRNAVWSSSAFKFNSEQLEDSSGNVGTLTNSGAVKRANGILGADYEYDGNGQYISSSSSPSGINASDPFNMSIWFESHPDGLPLESYIFGVADNADPFDNFSLVLSRFASDLKVAVFDRNTDVSPDEVIEIPNYTGKGYFSVNVSVSGSELTFIHDGTTYTATSNRRLQGSGFNEISVGALRDSSPEPTINAYLDEAEILLGSKSADFIATEYANQNDPATFYGTPTMQATGGGGAFEQPVVSVNAEEVHQANTLSISAFNSVSSVIAEQAENANLIDVFLSQLTPSIQAQEAHDATALSIEQSASQAVNSLTAEQTEQANSIGITQSALVNSVQAQESQQANTLTIEQSAGQSIILNTAQQVEQGTVLSLAQQQALAHIVAEQLSDASFADVSNLQAVTMIIAEETHHANTLNVEQYTGQFVTLITAEQKSESQKLLISEVSAIDVLQAEQVTNAETMAFNQVQRLTQITAEQLTQAQLLTILTSGDNTDLSGLRLIPVTSKYTINPTNTTRYSLQKV